MALELFVRDKDPISIQCLACGGGEVMEGLAETQGDEPFAMQILKTQPEMDRKAVRRMKNQYWNAFKHFFDMKGIPREDEQLLAKFSDVNNDVALFIGWLGLHEGAEAPANISAGISGLVVRAQRRETFAARRS